MSNQNHYFIFRNVVSNVVRRRVARARFAALNNYIGWSISMVALGTLALESFGAAAALLVGPTPKTHVIS